MRVLKSSLFWGVVLIVAGGLLLLEALGVLATAFIWPVIFGAAGLVFLYAFFNSRDAWWAAIPGFALLGLAAVTVWDVLGPRFPEEVGGGLFLAGVGLGFLAVYLASHERWWALIPAGALITLAVVAGLSSTVEGTAITVVLFMGLAATFGLLAILPTDKEGRTRWPLIPAAVLALVGVLVGIGAAGALNYLWPAALIVGGLYLIFHTFGSGRRPPRPHG